MKLFLTSGGLPPETIKEFFKLLNKKPKGIKLCFDTTASYGEHPKGNPWYVKKDRQQLLDLGFKVMELDLRTENKKSLKEKLKNIDVIFVEGGNTFYLLKYVRESGFDKVIKLLLKKKMIYVGVSAGSIIAGLNIDSAGWKHADRNIVNLKDLTGLKLVPFVITPHTDETNIEVIKKCASKANYPVIALSDKQAALIKGKTKRIVGIGNKLIFNTTDRF